MADYLIKLYNSKVVAIQDREASDLRAALEIYTAASNTIIERAALERVEAGVELAAAMSQRDHEYHNGRPAPVEKPSVPESTDPGEHETQSDETSDAERQESAGLALADVEPDGHAGSY